MKISPLNSERTNGFAELAEDVAVLPSRSDLRH
jgi:hypothetical protein